MENEKSVALFENLTKMLASADTFSPCGPNSNILKFGSELGLDFEPPHEKEKKKIEKKKRKNRRGKKKEIIFSHFSLSSFCRWLRRRLRKFQLMIDQMADQDHHSLLLVHLLLLSPC